MGKTLGVGVTDGSTVGYSLGVDVGTTYTAVGISRSGRAEIAPLGARGWSVPSVVYLGADQTVLVGDPAVRRSPSDPLRVVREFKRRIGDPVPLMVGGAPVSADTLTGMVLRAVVQQVVALETGPPDHAVLTHPANWGPYKIDCLWQAIRMATLDQLCPVSLMSEPEAAAAYYASAERLAPGDIIAVYDLGGGTFDAAVLRRTDTGWEFLAPAEGIERLGGIDFDEAVLAHVDAATDGQVRALDPTDTDAMAALLQLRRDCVDAKEALSSDIDATIRVALPTYHADVRLTRAEFEAMVEPSVRVSVDALNRVLRSAGTTPEQLHAVLLVGGSSRIPLVSQIVGQTLHVPVAVDTHPKHSIALGAALTAGQRAAAGPGRWGGRRGRGRRARCRGGGSGWRPRRDRPDGRRAAARRRQRGHREADRRRRRVPPDLGHRRGRGGGAGDRGRHGVRAHPQRRRTRRAAAPPHPTASTTSAASTSAPPSTSSSPRTTASSSPSSPSSSPTPTTSSASITPGVPVPVQVSSTVPWTATGVECAPGEVLDIAATGTILHNKDDPASATGPDGLTEPFFRQFNVPGLPPDANTRRGDRQPRRGAAVLRRRQLPGVHLPRRRRALPRRQRRRPGEQQRRLQRDRHPPRLSRPTDLRIPFA